MLAWLASAACAGWSGWSGWRAGSDHELAIQQREDRARSRLERKYGLRQLVTSPLETLDESGVAYYLRAREQASAQAGLF